MKILTIAITNLLIVFAANSQTLPTGTLKGKVVEQSTKQPISGAAVTTPDKQFGATTDSTGIFVIRDMPVGTYPLNISMVGFQPKSISEIEITKGKTYYLEIELLDAVNQLDEFSVATYKGENDTKFPVSTYSFTREEIFRNPGAQGDIFRAIGILPGVISSGAQYSAIAVRGQGTADNVYMVDDMPMFELSHLEFEGFNGGFNDPNGGRFSIFAPRVIDNALFQGGGFSPQYGRKSSSYLGLDVKEGNKETSSFSGQFDLLGFTLIGDGPVTTKTSVFVSARYQNFSTLAKLINYPAADPPLYGDYMIKTTTEINSKNKLSFIAMYNPEQVGRTVGDVVESGNVNDLNATTFIGHSKADKGIAGLSLRTLTSKNSYWKNILYYRISDVSNDIGNSSPTVTSDGDIINPGNIPNDKDLRHIKNNQTEGGYRSIFTQHFNKAITLTAGIDLARIDLDYSRTLKQDDTLYTFYANDFRPDPSQYYLILQPANFNSTFKKSANNVSGYLDFSFSLFKRLTLNPGVRYDYTGFSDQHTFSPRISGSISLDEKQSLNFASGIFYQDPAEVDLVGQPDGHKLKEERTIQNILGYKNQFSPDLKLVVEGWYKQFDDLIVRPKTGESFLTNAGTGYAYGGDINLTQRLSKKYYGQISYSYMVSKRDDHNGLGEYDFGFSRPHVISVLGSYKPNDKWIFSAKFRYLTGSPTDEFLIHPDVFNNASLVRYSAEVINKNGKRLKDFTSLDVRVDYKVQVKKTSLTAFVDIVDILNYTNQNSAFLQPLTGKTYYLGLAVFPSFGLRIEI